MDKRPTVGNLTPMQRFFLTQVVLGARVIPDIPEKSVERKFAENKPDIFVSDTKLPNYKESE